MEYMPHGYMLSSMASINIHQYIVPTLLINIHICSVHLKLRSNHQGVILQPVTKLRNNVDANLGEHRPRT